MLIVMIIGKWSDDSACCVVHDIWLYNVLDTVDISGDAGCYSVVWHSSWCVCIECYVDRVADDICY